MPLKKVDFSGSPKSVAPARNLKLSESSSKTLLQNRVSKGETLMFVRRDVSGDEKKAIFIRITNIAFSASGNNETVRAIKKHVSVPVSMPSTPSMPSSPRKLQTKKPSTKSYLNILQRHKKSSFASLVDHYTQIEESYEKEYRRKNVSLEEELHQMDTFFNSLMSKSEKRLAKVHVEEEDFKIARLWHDLGFTVVKSKNRPSLFEISPPQSSPVKQDSRLQDIRKSLMYISLSQDPPSKSSDSDTKEDRSVNQHSVISSLSKEITPNKQAGSPQLQTSKTVISWTVTRDAKQDVQAKADPKTDGSKPTSNIRKYTEKLKSLFSRKKDSASSKELSPSTSKDAKTIRRVLDISKKDSTPAKDHGANSADESNIHRRVKWYDNKSATQSVATSLQEKERKKQKGGTSNK